MNDHREPGHDPDLGALLRTIDAPDHGDGFWAALRDELASEASSDRRPEHEAEAADSDADGLELPAATPLPSRRSSTTDRRWLAVAAAALLVVAGVVLSLGQGSGTGDVGVATDPSPGPGPDPTDDAGQPEPGDPNSPLRLDGVVDDGQGLPVAVDPESRFLYVSAADPDGGAGCEGMDRQTLFVQPLGGGDAVEAVPDADVDGTGGLDVVFGADDQVALVETCEGFTSRVLTGTIAADGTIGGVEELQLPVDRVLDLAWVADGLLVASTSTSGAEGDERTLFELPATPSEPTDLGRGDVVWLDADPDGQLATVGSDGTVRWGDAVIGTAPDAEGIAVSPDGAFAAVHGRGGLRLFSVADEPAPRILSEEHVTDAAFTTGGDLLHRTIGSDDSVSLWSVRTDSGDEPVELLSAPAPTELRSFVVAPDASHVVLGRFDETGGVGAAALRHETHRLSR